MTTLYTIFMCWMIGSELLALAWIGRGEGI